MLSFLRLGYVAYNEFRININIHILIRLTCRVEVLKMFTCNEKLQKSAKINISLIKNLQQEFIQRNVNRGKLCFVGLLVRFHFIHKKKNCVKWYVNYVDFDMVKTS